jgi:nitrous oxide reductase accessory protein NosL
VLTGGAAVAVSLSGCLGSDGDDGGDVPEPISLTQDDQCEVCGMIIPNHPGPTAEIFYADQTPSGHANPAWFDSTWEAFQYDFERENEGWERQAFYVTDYSSVEYELTTDAGDTLISTHVGADDFVDAAGVTFVAGSEVKGAMGRDLIGFSEQADAEEFQSEYGGTVVAFEDVTESTIAELASI